MRKGSILHPTLNQLLTETGHTDTIVVTDAGLPIPVGIPHRIDLALKEGVPRFLDVLDTVVGDLLVEGIILAEEIKTSSPEMNEAILKRFPNVPVEYVPHITFKEKTAHVRGAIRSGEFTSYANIILVAGVAY
ncbi:D-ribose pyranase [Mammaliicoccus sciuri]|uniref:D-ribose pyranase n=1 Tax=Sporosarcina newyorkensis TaxID=759851 RepID=A0A1T4XYR5_9BACL|nr:MULTISPECIES: D-ribose pyranase [Sporosarcina]MBY0221573.1 D-ribose pyranase [Sporosarcina aquimarina]SKA94697.1 ribose transport protein RbsD [Sporosarcina newyorkensis]